MKEAAGMFRPFQILTETSPLEHSWLAWVSGLPQTFSASPANLLSNAYLLTLLSILLLLQLKKKLIQTQASFIASRVRGHYLRACTRT